MFFRLNQSKKFQIGELSFVLLSGMCIALMSTVLLYAISNLIIIKIRPDIDVLTNPIYLSVFAVHFIAVFLAYPVCFLKAKKGVEVKENEIIYHMGYYSGRSLPQNFLKTYGVILIDKIVYVEYIESFSWKELKKDYRNSNYMWYCAGNRINSLPAAKLRVKTDNIDVFFILPLEDSKGFVDEIKSKL